MSVDPQGRVFVDDYSPGRIHVFAAETGELLAEWETAPDYTGWYEAIAVTPKRDVVAIHPRELVKYDPRAICYYIWVAWGQDYVETIGVSEFGIRFTGLVVDGVGNLYLSTSENFVLKLDENGNLIDRLPVVLAEDDIEAIAVDGQGNIAWVYTYNPVINDQNGKYLGDFKSDFLSDAELNLKGQLVGISRNPPQIEVYTLTSLPGR